VEYAPVAVAGPVIVIERMHDPHRVAVGTAARVSAVVVRALERAGFAAAPRGERTAPDAAFLVSPTVHAVTVTPEGPRTTITCSVTLRIAPWSAADQTERWEPHVTAAALGEARATTSSARAQVALGITDCLESAVYAAASREVIPFLRRIDSEP
jgi:hypothetical protein